MANFCRTFNIEDEKISITFTDFIDLSDKDYFNKNTVSMRVLDAYLTDERCNLLDDKNIMKYIQVSYKSKAYSGDTIIKIKNYLYKDNNLYKDGLLMSRFPKEIKCALNELKVI